MSDKTKNQAESGKTAAKPGPTNTIADVSGILVGQAVDLKAQTGTTVVLPEKRVVAGVDVRGGAPGTRETDALDPTCLVDAIDAVVLSGGSVYGLEAASAVTSWLGARGRGYELAGTDAVAPVVPAAILFDLTNGGDKSWGEEPPYNELGRLACENASMEIRIGKEGAGIGARAGAYEGGLGSASVVFPDGLEIGAIVAVNSFGSPYIPGTDILWAQTSAMGDEMGSVPDNIPMPLPSPLDYPEDTKVGAALAGSNTTIGVVATNASLTSAQANRIALMAQDGFARALRPVHGPTDGDVIFAISTAEHELQVPLPLSLTRLGMAAADCMARAIGRAIFASNG